MSVWFDGQPIVAETGTGVYLGRRALRDWFRGVAAHATVCVDGEEPSPVPLTRPFALPSWPNQGVSQLRRFGKSIKLYFPSR